MSASPAQGRADTDEGAPPSGFVTMPALHGFIEHNGPLYGRQDADGAVFGFRVQRHHCNPLGVCHGGWLATFADMLLPLSARLDSLDRFLLTVHLDIDYLAPAPLGAWVEGRARVLRRTARMVFVDGTAAATGEIVMRASGVFRIGPEAAPLVIG